MVMVGLIVGSWDPEVCRAEWSHRHSVPKHVHDLSVPVALWMVVCFPVLPAAPYKKHPAFIGLGTLFLSYIVC